MGMNPVTFAKDVSLQLFQPAFRKGQKDKCWEWDKVFNVQTSKRASEQVFSITPMGAAISREVNQEVPFLDLEELASTTWTHTTYMLGARIPMQLIEDGQYVQYTKEIGWSIGQGHQYVKDVAAANVFINAWTTTLWDGYPLCSNSHVTTKTGDSIDNDLGAVSLDWDSVWDAAKYFEYGVKDEAGMPYYSKPSTIVFHPSKFPEALKLQGNEWEPDTGYRNPNTLKDHYNLTLVPCKLLSSSGGVYPWFVLSEKFKQDNIFWNRLEPKVDEDNDFTRYGLMFRSRSRHSCGPRDYREAIGATG